MKSSSLSIGVVSIPMQVLVFLLVERSVKRNSEESRDITDRGVHGWA
jgi:hypothetical protein